MNTEIGSISMISFSTIPDGFLTCEGQGLSTDNYSELHNSIGYMYGGSLGNFNIPDFTNTHMRGWNNSKSTVGRKDDEVTTRTNRGDTTTGDYVGTKQIGWIQGHIHFRNFETGNANIVYIGGPYPAAGPSMLGGSDNYSSTNAAFYGRCGDSNYGASVNNPYNKLTYFCIKYSNVDDPIGSISYFPYQTVPEGWLHCNGASLNTTAYKELYNAIGYNYGGGAGSFNIPDYRGYFLKFMPAQNVYTYSNTPHIESHKHGSPGTDGNYLDNAPAYAGSPGYASDPGITSEFQFHPLEDIFSDYNNFQTLGSYDTPRTSTELRPRNINMMACIKYI